MSTDFIAGAYAGVKALILADSWLTTPGNGVRRFVWMDGTKPNADSELPRKAPGDVAELEMDWTGLNDDAGRPIFPTFGNRNDATAPYVGTQKIDLEIRIVNKDTRITPVSAIATKVLDVLKSGATINAGSGGTARLGQVTVRPTIEKTTAAAGGTERRVVIIRVPITVTFRGP